MTKQGSTGVIEHGLTLYQHGCRCPRCRAANTRYHYWRQAEQITQRQAALGEVACVHCGATEHIQWDHRNPLTRTLGDGKGMAWMQRFLGKQRYREELAKVQPLCTSCHRRKQSLWRLPDGSEVWRPDMGSGYRNLPDPTWLGWRIGRDGGPHYAC